MIHARTLSKICQRTYWCAGLQVTFIIHNIYVNM